MSFYFKTPKGTELPLLDLKGQKYLTVQYRVVWFREEHPLWQITTDIIESKDGFVVKATISDDKGFVVATAHKWSGSNKYPLECAETGAIGRCLSFIGYGTAHCGDELSEGEELADSPVGEENKPVCELCSNYLVYSERKAVWFCPNYKQTELGQHTSFRE